VASPQPNQPSWLRLRLRFQPSNFNPNPDPSTADNADGDDSGDLLRPYILDGRELVFLPVCAECGKPITDLDNANLVVANTANGSDENDADDTNEISADGMRLQRINGRVLAFHTQCDPGNHRPWVRASQVLRANQTGPRSILGIV
jgi:hypothetical protein